MNSSLLDYTLYLADSALVLAQRNGAWCGHGPILEQDIAITNITLDLVGQARSFYQYAATLKGEGATEDSLAYLRGEREFKNCLLAECPNGDWSQTILRQFFFSCFQRELFNELQHHADPTLSAIAVKSLKEVNYHCRWSGEWVVRLGDGTEESHQRITKSLQALWTYTGELFKAVDYEIAMGIDLTILHSRWMNVVNAVLTEATLSMESLQNVFMHTGGKQGIHTEELGPLLAEMQYMQRAYPNTEW
jgi:ring-1,2-phenylacetyl-CoA epoxidase subunit PaaC